MRPPTARSLFSACAAAGLALSLPVAAAEEPQVLLALDSSRSLSVEQNRAAAELARNLVVRLAATTQASVLTFDDGVHWLARPGEGGAEAALHSLPRTGRYTVMHDGLIEGVRALEASGVLVLISDGKDEGSATTLEDVARLASERGVRVVALGAGQVDERTMKRLALLTGGLYAGPVSAVDPDALTAEVEALRRRVAAERTPPAAAPAPPATAVAETAPPVPAAAPEPARDSSRLLLLAGALVAAVGIVVGFLLARRRTPHELGPDRELQPDTRPGLLDPEPAARPASAPAPAAEAEPEPIDEIQLARLRGRSPIPAGGLLEVSLDDTAAFQRLPFSESIERTLVLTEEVVLTVREPGQERRTFRIPPGRAIDIGRDTKRNTLGFHDPTMSMHHLRLALEEGEILLVDQGSTNGVLFQGRRVESTRLHPGDHFRAGMIEFELNLHRASVT
jgi:hypothetical protein